MLTAAEKRQLERQEALSELASSIAAIGVAGERRKVLPPTQYTIWAQAMEQAVMRLAPEAKPLLNMAAALARAQP